MSEPIPAVWRIDVEPDEVQLVQWSWDGFGVMAALVHRLRRRLEDRSGSPVHPTWFMRFDPDIGRHHGRTDFVAEHHAGTLDGIRRHEDPLGIHVHAHRWMSA